VSSAYDAAQRDEPVATFAMWMGRFGHHAGRRRPLSVLDLGSGTGKFAPALADAFGGPVVGVEPSGHMRAISQRDRSHPAVTYLDGSAERIPLADGAVDLVVMFLVLQHVADRAAAAAEIARVLKRGGRVLVVSHLRGEATPRAWSAYFPEARDIEERSLPTMDEAKAMFAPHGLRFVALDRQLITVCPSLRTYLERIRLRSISSLERLSEAEFAAGVAALEADVARETIPEPVQQLADLLVFQRENIPESSGHPH
ncbi:MAG: class I SAM-dependent methyltransferase, partial [Actinobacteria bacterium]|nr:class I SAM-dependent methyltransferase [Actinomycetota bacterium]